MTHPVLFDLHGPVWVGPLLSLSLDGLFGQHDEHVFLFRLQQMEA